MKKSWLFGYSNLLDDLKSKVNLSTLTNDIPNGQSTSFQQAPLNNHHSDIQVFQIVCILAPIETIVIRKPLMTLNITYQLNNFEI